MDFCRHVSRVGWLWKFIQKDADTSNMVTLTVMWRVFWFIHCAKMVPSYRLWEWLHHCCFVTLWESIHDFFLDFFVCKECAPSVPVSRLLGCSGFFDPFGCAEDSASNNIQEIISLDSGLIYNYSPLFGGRMGFKILVRYSCYMWKFLNSKYDVMFADPLMCWECRDTS